MKMDREAIERALWHAERGQGREAAALLREALSAPKARAKAKPAAPAKGADEA